MADSDEEELKEAIKQAAEVEMEEAGEEESSGIVIGSKDMEAALAGVDDDGSDTESDEHNHN